jgi:hypothetical protein
MTPLAIYINTVTTTCISEVIDYYIFNKNIYYFLEYKSCLLSCESLFTSYLNILFFGGLRIQYIYIYEFITGNLK